MSDCENLELMEYRIGSFYCANHENDYDNEGKDVEDEEEEEEGTLMVMALMVILMEYGDESDEDGDDEDGDDEDDDNSDGKDDWLWFTMTIIIMVKVMWRTRMMTI